MFQSHSELESKRRRWKKEGLNVFFPEKTIASDFSFSW